MTAVRRLDRAQLLRATRSLARRDGDLADVVRRHGPPPLWARRPGFETLVRIVLEQQVSLASAAAMIARLRTHLGALRPGLLAEADEAGLRALGVTRQKARTLTRLSRRVVGGQLDLARLARRPEAETRDGLLALHGVGPWTADVYLLMALRRPDVWPRGDVALLTAYQHLRGLRARPDDDAVEAQVEAWRPWRAVGARLLWHGYLQGSLRGRPRAGRAGR